MKQIPLTLKLLLLTALSLLLLAACERPVPGAQPVDATGTPVITLPTVAPTGGEAATPIPVDSTGDNPAYPAPGEGDTSGGDTSGGDTSGGDTSGGNTSGGDASGGDTSGDTSGGTNPTAPTSHTVQAGDTLYSIALQYGLTIQELATANNITDVNSLSVGDTLTIPAPGTVSDSQQGGGQVPSSGEQIHTVAPGENLFRIGLRYGFTVAELASYNNIANPNSIAVGQQIRIPAR